LIKRNDDPFRARTEFDTGHDGVVSVERARLDGVDSELIVRSGHSTQSHPATMREVRRILRSGLE
jgi:hypothetical protein